MIDMRIEIFKRLSNKIGKGRVILRYDPIFLNNKYTIEYHVEAFQKIASHLKNYTEKCVISFIDYYKHTSSAFNTLVINLLLQNDTQTISESLSSIIADCNMKIETCAENIDLGKFNISHGAQNSTATLFSSVY